MIFQNRQLVIHQGARVQQQRSRHRIQHRTRHETLQGFFSQVKSSANFSHVLDITTGVPKQFLSYDKHLLWVLLMDVSSSAVACKVHY